MAVVYWQLFVISSVALTFYIWGKTSAAIVAIGWTLFSVAAIYTTPLLATQLGSAWATWFISNRMHKQKTRLNSLEHILRDYDPVRQWAIEAEARKAHDKSIIAGKSHYEELVASLESVRADLCILSGWIRSGVVDAKFERLAAVALQRGASLWIGYGWRDNDGRHNIDNRAKSRLERLGKKAVKSQWPGSLHLREFATHEKVLTKDDSYVIYGSNNWLSNRRFRNSERSIKILDQEVTKRERDRIRRLVRTGGGDV